MPTIIDYSNQETRVTSSPPILFFALDVAEGYLADCPEMPEEEQSNIKETALLIGQHLSESEHAGNWTQFQATQFYAQIDFMSELEVVKVTMNTTQLYMWLAIANALCVESCLSIINDIKKQCPQVCFLLDALDCVTKAIIGFEEELQLSLN